MLEGNVSCFSSPGLNQLQNLSKKCWVLYVNCKQKKTEEITFFNWLSNLKNLVLSNDSKNVQNVIQMALKQLKLQKFPKSRPWPPSAGGPIPRPPSEIVSYICFFTVPQQFNTYILKTLTFSSSSSPLTNFCLYTNLGPRLLIFHSKVFLSHKKIPTFQNL